MYGKFDKQNKGEKWMKRQNRRVYLEVELHMQRLRYYLQQFDVRLWQESFVRVTRVKVSMGRI